MSDKMLKGLLPNGQEWEATEDAHATAWACWRGIAKVALEKGWGVELYISNGRVFICSVFAPLGQMMNAFVHPLGSYSTQGEPDSPMLEMGSREVPWMKFRQPV